MKLHFPRFRKFDNLLVVLSIVWFLTFLLHERWLPYRAARSCQWSLISPAGNQTNVLLIADPQLIDNHTYPGRNSLLLAVSKHTADVYMRKNYRALMNTLLPDYLYFLGDLLDNGRSASDEYFSREVRRFKSLFPDNLIVDRFPNAEHIHYRTNLPGNHDIGWSNGVKLHSRERFQSTFGTLNSIDTINGVEIISLDSLSLSNTEDETIYRPSKALINGLGSTMKTTPRILLTHVPLYRDANVDCGKYREAKKFPISKGYQYQTVLDASVTEEILSNMKPDLVFSGDDHDYCDVQHSDSVREITVKSISMAMGITYPAVQLLSFYADQEMTLHYKTSICYLPVPYANVANYAVFAVLTGLIIIAWNVHQKSRYTAVLPVTSIKLTHFLENNDDLEAPTPTMLKNYTTSDVKETRWRKWTKNTDGIMVKWNVWNIVKHCGLMGLIVCCIYFGFCIL